MTPRIWTEFYHVLLKKVRERQKPVTVQFRCDGPTVRRFMELELRPLEEGAVHLTGRLLREESRPHVALFANEVPRSGEFLIVCGWCKMVQVDDSWLEAEDAITRLRLFDGDVLPQLSHGICPACNERLREEEGIGCSLA